MTFEIGLTLAIIAGAIALFATEKLRVDVIALLVLLTVALTGLVSPKEAFNGFANSAVITVWAVYIVSGGMFTTGVADAMGRGILRLAGHGETRLIVVIMVTCGAMSAFMNNVGATAMLLPAVIGISRQVKIPVSKLLIPLSFASLLGGNMTLIGTPANILGANILIDKGLPGFQFFDFAPMGAIVFGVGILYMATLGRRLLPVRESPESREASSNRLREYVSEVQVPAETALVGKTLTESRLGSDYDLTVLSIIREGKPRTEVRGNSKIHAGDILVLEGHVQNLMKAQENLGVIVGSDRHPEVLSGAEEEVSLVEATLAPNTHLEGRTLQKVHFREQYGFSVVAIWRRGSVITRRLNRTPLRFGDALLMRGPTHRLRTLQEAEEFLLLEPLENTSLRKRKAPLAIGAMVLVLVLVMFLGIPIATAMVVGAVLMVLTGCLTMDEAYQSIDWKTVFLVAGMLPLGTAMENSGAARYLADLLLNAAGGLGPIAVLAGIYLLAALITQPMSNAAAVVLMVPIAVDTAQALGADVHPFVLATVIGASTSFLTPVGHKSNVLVFGPGGYKFFDYTRVGAPLTIAIFLALILALPLIWPLFP